MSASAHARASEVQRQRSPADDAVSQARQRKAVRGDCPPSGFEDSLISTSADEARSFLSLYPVDEMTAAPHPLPSRKAAAKPEGDRFRIPDTSKDVAQRPVAFGRCLSRPTRRISEYCVHSLGDSANEFSPFADICSSTISPRAFSLWQNRHTTTARGKNGLSQ